MEKIMTDKKLSKDNNVNLKDREKKKVQKPKKYKVVFHNDDYTPMDFVVILLVQIFRKSMEDSFNIMMAVHEKGKGIAGVYSKEIAETKSTKANEVSKASGFPLLTTIEPE